MSDKPPARATKSSPRVPQLAVAGTEMFGFALVGLLVDFGMGTIRTVPWATLILAPVGLIVGLIHLIQLVKSRPGS